MAEEDVKPKLNLSINHEGTVITVKVKRDMHFEKIFKAAEERFGRDPGTMKFIYEGVRVKPTETPASRDMEDGDVIDAFLEQIGGKS